MSREQRICLGATGRGIHRVTKASEIPNDGGSNRSLVVDDDDAEWATARRGHVWLGDDVSGLSARRYRHRQLDDERGAGARGLHADRSAVLPHDSVGDGQAKPRSLANAFCRVERVEDAIDLRRGNPRPGVVDRDHDPTPARLARYQDPLLAVPPGERL